MTGLFLDIMINHRARSLLQPLLFAEMETDVWIGNAPIRMSDSQYAQYLEFNTLTFESLFQQVKEIGRRHNKQFMMTPQFWPDL